MNPAGGDFRICDCDDDELPRETDRELLTGKMLKTRKILISGEINKNLAEKIIRQLLVLDDMGKGAIQLFIDSPGGDADAGFAVFDMIRFIRSPVWTIGMGLVASAAAIIQLASPKERRLGLPNSHYLIHQPLSGIRGVATDIEIHSRELDKLRRKINGLISQETDHPVEQVEKDTDRDYWMNADEAVSYGLISKVIIRAEDMQLPGEELYPAEKPAAGKAVKAPLKKTAAKTAEIPAARPGGKSRPRKKT